MSNPSTDSMTILCAAVPGGQLRADQLAPLKAVALSRGGVLMEGTPCLSLAFSTARQAAAAAHAARHAGGAPLETVALALHSVPSPGLDPQYAGSGLERCRALIAAAPAGVTLVSDAAAADIDTLPSGTELRELGSYRLSDLIHAAPLYALVPTDSPAELPPVRSLEQFHTNLPVQPYALIGRAAEVTLAAQLLRESQHRLITLRGPSGTGKTRLAVQIAAELLGHFDSGVYFINLAPVTDPTLVLATIARTLGIGETRGQQLIDALAQQLIESHMLLVIDNVEQVLGSAPDLQALLDRAPQIKLLVTSQELLGLAHEHEIPLTPLALPDSGTLPSVAQLLGYPAIALFVERARAQAPGFELTEEHAASVVELCQSLRGLPLGIELVAPYVKLLSPRYILLQLKLRLGVRTPRRGPGLNRSELLWHVLDWSYHLLRPEEQQLFDRLSIFVGGSTLEAIEAICNAEGDLAIDVLSAVETFLDRNLLLQEEFSEGQVRYIMLDAIHEYVTMHLEEQGASDLYARHHRDYYLQLAEHAEPELRGPQQRIWIAQLDGEHHNLRAAISRSIASGDTVSAQRLSGALARFWMVRGYLSEGRRWLDRSLALQGSEPAVRAKALHGLGVIANTQGDYQQAVAAYEASLETWREIDDQQRIASTLGSLGITAGIQGQHERARDFFEQSLAAWRVVGDPWGIASTLGNLGVSALDQGDYERAQTLLEESRSLWTQVNDRRSLGIVLLNLGNIAAVRGEHQRALEMHEEGLALFRELRDTRMIADMLSNLGHDQLATGNVGLARTTFEEALGLWETLHAKRGIIIALEGLARVSVSEGAPEQALQVLSAAAAVRQDIGAPEADNERRLNAATAEQASAQLSPAQAEAARAAGSALALSAAADLVRSTPA